MINRALRLIRQMHDLQQVELAEKLNISKTYIIELESGKKPADSIIIEKYATHFNIPTSTLIFFSESLTNKKSSRFKTAFGNKTLDAFERILGNEKKKK
ncbi:XRE family transcriptional regulator [Photobacterium gaetbulicola]|uniref:XRE family transcriptional regulator n=1 Tax=Photobacterium gaetbulicola TaxID=1295392 RepID=A0A0B9G6Z6_9GAMM|nr:helix-turn-helix transcriptional regulator [Photobacterium gaetbulicola]KHT64493.1 XRE family transcriptional regulator [Photobacterium gaetbulicola]